MFYAAVAAADPAEATARAVTGLPIERGRNVSIFAFGKAAVPMATAAVRALLSSLHSIVGGLVVSGDPLSTTPYATLASLAGDHPVPSTRSFAASDRIAALAPGRRASDVVIVLLSGGTTSLVGAPLTVMNGADLAQLYEILLGSGLDIASMNTIRKRFTRWGAGRLALALSPATTYCFALSDVADDDLSAIASGPCAPDSTTAKEVIELLTRANLLTRIPNAHREYLAAVIRGAAPETPKKTHPAFAHVSSRVISSNIVAVEGAAAAARAHNLTSDVSATRLSGEAAHAGESIARQLLDYRAAGQTKRCYIWGGETAVTITGAASARPSGGGRCQELALAAARVLDSAGENGAGITLLAAGTDGRDGATDAAGAVVDGTTWRAILERGVDPANALAVHESHAALHAANALIPRRDTATNVNDVVIALLDA